MCDASIDFVVAAIHERLRLKQASGFRALNIDELMAGVVNDIYLDHSYLDPADIAATFRREQQSDECRDLINNLVIGSEIVDVDQQKKDTEIKKNDIVNF